MLDDFDNLVVKLPGVIGSAGALLWWKGSWMKKVALFFLGVAASHYGTNDFSTFSGLSEGLSGFILGLGSMAVVDWALTSFRPILTQYMKDKLKIKDEQN